MSSLEAQMTHAAWDSERGHDIEEEARRDPFLAAHIAACDRKYGNKEKKEMAHEDGDKIICSEECAVEYRNNQEEDEEDGE